jgi:hypothetical protein
MKNKLFILTVIGIQIYFIPPTIYGRVRSEAAKNEFKHSNPCPSNGNNHGPCPGYVIDHITPLACNGNDGASNMQWQSVAEGKAKDKWERKDCQPGHASFSRIQQSGEYHLGKKGGCFIYTSSAKKRYVDRSYCGN